MKETERIIYCTPPIKTNLYRFACEHSLCNFIVKSSDIVNEASDVEVLAYATNPENNNYLDKEFEHNTECMIIVNTDFSDPLNNEKEIKPGMVKGGIGYFNPPLSIHKFNFMDVYPGCNFVIEGNDKDNMYVDIIAYATAIKYNNKLVELYCNASDYTVINGIDFSTERMVPIDGIYSCPGKIMTSKELDEILRSVLEEDEETEEQNKETDKEQNSLSEDDIIQTKFHNENSIYLYATMDNLTADNIINMNKYPVPLMLYETPSISREIGIDFLGLSNPVTLKIAVNLLIKTNEHYYDELTMTNKIDNMEKCKYVRRLIDYKNSKIIQYKVYEPSIMCTNAQHVDIK